MAAIRKNQSETTIPTKLNEKLLKKVKKVQASFGYRTQGEAIAHIVREFEA